MNPTATIELRYLPPSDLYPNTYNPNVLDEDLFQKAIASIREYGFVDPVTVRLVGSRYEIIDGEHRVRAARKLKLITIPVIVLDADDDTAQRLTLVLNELRGRPDRAKLDRILVGLAERHSVDALLATLPFAREQFSLTIPPPIGSSLPPRPDAVRWVERMYRLPRTASDTLDAALERAKEYEEIAEDWKALEVIAKHYLESG